MEQMGTNCEINCNGNQIKELVGNILVSNYDDSNVASIIITLNNILASTDPIANIPEVNALINAVELKLFPNTMVEVLVKEIKCRIIRETAMSGMAPETQDEVKTEEKKYRDEEPRCQNQGDNSVSCDGRRRFIPQNNNFQLPPPGETGNLINKYIDPETGKMITEKLLIDHEGYVVEVLDKYFDASDNPSADEEAYTELMKNVMSYDDLEEDEKSDPNCEGSADKNISFCVNSTPCEDDVKKVITETIPTSLEAINDAFSKQEDDSCDGNCDCCDSSDEEGECEE